MNFLEAMQMNRPMRRTSWLQRGPIPPAAADAARILQASTWMFPRVLVEKDGETCWINIASGRPLTLTRIDYLATDWEVMP